MSRRPNKPMVLTVWAASLRSAAHRAAHRPAVGPAGSNLDGSPSERLLALPT